MCFTSTSTTWTSTVISLMMPARSLCPPASIYERNASQVLAFTGVCILDPAIEANNSNYAAFADGYKSEVYVKWPESVNASMRFNPIDVPNDKDVIYGHVWPKGYGAFPDFFKNATADWWKRWISHMYNDLGLKFDALWIVS